MKTRTFSLLSLSLVACGSPSESAVPVENSPVVISEVSSSTDQLELYNRSGAAVDLSAWFIQDEDQAAEKTYAFPAGSTIAAGAFLVLEKGTAHAFGFGKDDVAYLYDVDGELADVADWPTNGALESWCRVPDGTGEFGECKPTFGAANSR